MGEARRRKLAGNTKPDEKWHQRKAADKHGKKVMREMIAAASENPIGFSLGLTFAARAAAARRNK